MPYSERQANPTHSSYVSTVHPLSATIALRRASADQPANRIPGGNTPGTFTSTTSSFSESDAIPARRVKSAGGAEGRSLGSFDANASRSSNGSGKTRRSSFASSASSLVRGSRHSVARNASSHVPSIPFFKKASKRINSFSSSAKTERKTSNDGAHTNDRKESDEARTSQGGKIKKSRQRSHETKSSMSSAEATISDNGQPHNIEVSAEEAKDIITAHREGLEEAQHGQKAIPGPKEIQWSHMDPASSASNPQPYSRQAFRLDFSRLAPRLQYPAAGQAQLPMLDPTTPSPGTIPFNAPLKPDLTPISESDNSKGGESKKEYKPIIKHTEPRSNRELRKQLRSGSRETAPPAVRFGSTSTERSSGRTSTSRSSQSHVASSNDTKSDNTVRKQSAPSGSSNRRRSFRHWLFKTSGRSHSEPSDKLRESYIARALEPTVDSYVYPLIDGRSQNKVSSVTGMSQGQARDFGEERKKPGLKRRMSIKTPVVDIGITEDRPKNQSRQSLVPKRVSPPAFASEPERREYFERRMTGSPLANSAISVQMEGRSPGPPVYERLSEDSIRGSDMYFNPPEKKRLEAPAAVHANLIKKPKVTSYYFDYRAPVGESMGSGQWDSDSQLMSQEPLPSVPEPIIRSQPAAPISRPWFRVRMDDEGLGEGGLDTEDGLTEYSAWDIPEHLPGSPLCPMSFKHKSGGKAICPVHGRRRTREGRAPSRSEPSPGLM